MNQTALPRTYTLTERVAGECRLTAADVEFLLAGHRTHLRLAPTGRRGRYRLTPTGHVGTIVGPDCRLVIRPKIPVKNLFHLLDPTGPLPVAEDRAATVTGTEALDFLAGRLARLLAERVVAGLHRAYSERCEAGPFLQGRLDLAAHLRERNGRKDRFHCRYEDFTADVPCNQVPKAAAELVLRSPLLADGVRAALRQALAAFAEVGSVVLGPESFRDARPDRLTEAYRPLLELSRLLAESLSPGEAAGAVPCPAFLLDLERVFEQYVTRGLVEGGAEGGHYAVSAQPLFRANRPVAGQADLLMRPDVTIDHDGRPVVVVDVKWKRQPASALVRPDLHQVLAYATALGARRAVLVYPGRRDCRWIYSLARAPVEVEVRTLRVVGSRDACVRSLRRLIRAVRRGCRALDRLGP
jgi:5-methylcytosine-specific restriction enzyme subunit McrC